MTDSSKPLWELVNEKWEPIQKEKDEKRREDQENANRVRSFFSEMVQKQLNILLNPEELIVGGNRETGYVISMMIDGIRVAYDDLIYPNEEIHKPADWVVKVQPVDIYFPFNELVDALIYAKLRKDAFL